VASVTRRIEVCDTCRELDRPIVARIRIAPEGERLRTVAFCAVDYTPMETVLNGIKGTFPTHNGRRPNRKVTLAQIEEIKKSTPRKRAAKATASARKAIAAT
jgi:hypothetical protein